MATKKAAPKSVRTSADIASEFSAVERKVASAPAVPEKEAALAAGRAAGIKSIVSGIGSVEKVTKALVELKLNLSSTLDSVSEVMGQKLEELHALGQEIELTQRELEEMYGKEVAAAKLADLVAQHAAKKAELDKEFAAHQERLETVRQADEAAATQLKNDRAIAHRREEAEYTYQRDQQRSKERDAFFREVEDVRRANDLKQQDLELGWKKREEALKAQEQEIEALKAKVAGFDAEKAKAIEAAVVESKKSLDASKHFEVSMLKKESESAKALAEQTINSLREQVSAKDALIRDLQAKFDAATSKVQSIAEKALDSQSDRKVAAAVQEMAATNAPTQAGRK